MTVELGKEAYETWVKVAFDLWSGKGPMPPHPLVEDHPLWRGAWERAAERVRILTLEQVAIGRAAREGGATAPRVRENVWTRDKPVSLHCRVCGGARQVTHALIGPTPLPDGRTITWHALACSQCGTMHESGAYAAIEDAPAPLRRSPAPPLETTPEDYYRARRTVAVRAYQAYMLASGTTPALWDNLAGTTQAIWLHVAEMIEALYRPQPPGAAGNPEEEGDARD